VSGTAPADPITGAIKGTTIQEQTAQCLMNIQAILEEAGERKKKPANTSSRVATNNKLSSKERVIYAGYLGRRL